MILSSIYVILMSIVTVRVITMKIYHLRFCSYILSECHKVDISIGELKALENENDEITKSLISATSDAVNCISRPVLMGRIHK